MGTTEREISLRQYDYHGIILPDTDPKNQGRYKVHIPELHPLIEVDKGIWCKNQVHPWRYTPSSDSFYGGYTPLQAGTKVLVAFYENDFNTGYIRQIISAATENQNPRVGVKNAKTPSTTDRDDVYVIFKTPKKHNLFMVLEDTTDSEAGLDKEGISNSIHLYYNYRRTTLIINEDGIHWFTMDNYGLTVEGEQNYWVNGNNKTFVQGKQQVYVNNNDKKFSRGFQHNYGESEMRTFSIGQNSTRSAKKIAMDAPTIWLNSGKSKKATKAEWTKGEDHVVMQNKIDQKVMAHADMESILDTPFSLPTESFGIAELLSSATEAASSEIASAANSITSAASSALGSATLTASSALGSATSAVSSTVNSASSLASSTLSSATSAASSTVNTATSAVSTTVNTATSAVTGAVSEAINSATSAVSEAASSVAESLSFDLWGGMPQDGHPLSDVISLLKGFDDRHSSLGASQLGLSLRGFPIFGPAISAFIDGVVSTVTDAVSGVVDTVVDNVASAASAASEAVSGCTGSSACSADASSSMGNRGLEVLNGMSNESSTKSRRLVNRLTKASTLSSNSNVASALTRAATISSMTDSDDPEKLICNGLSISECTSNDICSGVNACHSEGCSTIVTYLNSDQLIELTSKMDNDTFDIFIGYLSAYAIGEYLDKIISGGYLSEFISKSTIPIISSIVTRMPQPQINIIINACLDQSLIDNILMKFNEKACIVLGNVPITMLNQIWETIDGRTLNMLAPLFNKITSIKFICGADKKSIYVGVVKMDPSSLMCMLNKIGNDILDFKTSCLGDVACPNILRSCLLNIGGNNG